MKQPIVCTICSREKSKSKGRLTARKRYLGGHIKLAEAAANKDNLPFFIVSGKDGLLAGGQLVDHYDQQLTEQQVPRLVARLCTQFFQLAFEVTEIRFYTKMKDSWKPYRDALQQAAAKLQIPVTVIELADDA
jgi:hypothetical protein